MRLVGFRSRWIEPILAGTKTTTIRPAGSSLPRPGEAVGLRCRYDRPPFAHALVTGLDTLGRSAITDDLARADGFEDAAALRSALDELYGSRPLVLVSFRLVERPDDPLALFG